jgi:hypothetical protein
VKTVGAFTAGVIATLLVAIAVLHFADLEITDDGSGSDFVVTVPNLLGQSGVDAEADLNVAGLRVKLEQYLRPSPLEKELGGRGRWLPAPASEAAVRRQDPDPGTKVEPDSLVTLGVR